MTLCVVDRTEKGIVRIMTDRKCVLVSDSSESDSDTVKKIKKIKKEGWPEIVVCVAGHMESIYILESYIINATDSTYFPELFISSIHELKSIINGSTFLICIGDDLYNEDGLLLDTAIGIGSGNLTMEGMMTIYKDKTVKECFIETLRVSDDLSNDYDEVIIKADHGLEDTYLHKQPHGFYIYSVDEKLYVYSSLKMPLEKIKDWTLYTYSIERTHEIAAYARANIDFTSLSSIIMMDREAWKSNIAASVLLISSEGLLISISRDGDYSLYSTPVNKNFGFMFTGGMDRGILKALQLVNPYSDYRDLFRDYLVASGHERHAGYLYNITDGGEPEVIKVNKD